MGSSTKKRPRPYGLWKGALFGGAPWTKPRPELWRAVNLSAYRICQFVAELLNWIIQNTIMGSQDLPRLFGIFWVLITLPQIYYFGLRGYEGEGPLQVLFNVNLLVVS